MRNHIVLNEGGNVMIFYETITKWRLIFVSNCKGTRTTRFEQGCPCQSANEYTECIFILNAHVTW